MVNKNNEEKMQKMRHSAAHVLASTVLKLYPDAKLGIGPAIADGFYYDFDFGDQKISEADLEKISATMIRIMEAKLSFSKEEVSIAQAKKAFISQPFKLELISDLEKEGHKTVSIYRTGDFVDLCEGPHVDNASQIGPFKLLSIAGAYWRGSEKNKMLTRIYGACFSTKEELDKYLWQIEEAKKRDHKKIGQELDLFSFHEEGPGFIFWHPNGMKMRQPLIDFWQKLHVEAGYDEVSTPILLSDELWKKSGHWQNYKDKMYFTKIDKKNFALKPMNCPGMILIYKNRLHSYRELPIRWRELGLIHRHELSGTLNGLLRERAFRQDDAHIFCSENQVGQEIKSVIDLALAIYSAFKFVVQIELSTRPEKSIGMASMWNKAEDTLKKVLADLKLDYKLNEGEGAFYGPKIDFHLTDSLGRPWQCGTIQLDFAMPERFDLTYIDTQGQQKCPVMIHRTIFGSVHRFFGILIEHYAGAFPLWLSPCQVKVLPIADRHLEYTQKVHSQFLADGIRSELDDRNETLPAKIRDATLQKVPYMVIIGDREEKAQTVSVRTRDGKDLGPAELTKFIDKIKLEIEDKS